MNDSFRSRSRRLVAALAVTFAISPLAHALPALAETNFVTDGTTIISPNSVFGSFTSWEVDTSEPGAAEVTEIDWDFAGPDDDGIGDTEGWTVAYEGDEDDDYLVVPLDVGTTFNGEDYDEVFVGSNTYFTFGQGSDEYDDLAFDYPPIPGVHMCADDNSYQRVIYRTEGDNVRIRYEGTDETSGDLEAPTIVYELVVYGGQSRVDVHIGVNDRCQDDTLIPEIRGVERTGFTLSASSGTWRESMPLDISYQWQYYAGEAYADIEGETDSQYVIQGAYEGTVIRVAVTAENEGEEFADTQYSEDTSEITAPVEISTCEELMAIDTEYFNDDAFVLTEDIDCSETAANSLDWDSAFEGAFDGKGYDISSLTIDEPESENVGLFRHVSGTASIENFSLVNSSVTGWSNVGGVVGYVEQGDRVVVSDIVLSNVSVSAESNTAGGIVGNWYAPEEHQAAGTLRDVAFEGGTVHAAEGSVGGLVGEALADSGSSVNISASHVSDSDISSAPGGDAVGGLIGVANSENGNVTLDQCYVTGGEVGEIDEVSAGGLVGKIYSYGSGDGAVYRVQVKDSFANTVINGANAGGIAGYVMVDGGFGTGFVRVYNAYAAGSVYGGSSVGGIFGYVEPLYEEDRISISGSFSDMSFSMDGDPYVGGVIGYFDDAGETFPETFGGAYYNRDAALSAACDGSDSFECEAVNADGEDPDHFLGDSGVAPMDSWDFEGVWIEVADDYPVLGVSEGESSEPTVSTDTDVDTHRTSADLTGSLEDLGTSDVTEIGFEYGETEEYDGMVFDESESFEAGDFEMTIEDLDCRTTYHFRAYAISADGTGYGDDETFRTSSCGGGGGGGGGSTVYSEETGDFVDPNENDDEEAGDGTEDESEEETEDEGVSDESDDDSEPVTTFNEWAGHTEAPDSGDTGPSPFDGSVESISSVATGWYVRGENYDTVYLVGDDGKRHPFWDARTFLTWSSWDDVVWVTDATLATLPLGHAMLPKPGVVLVKIVDGASVYAIGTDDSGNAILHLIPSEAVAIAVFGEDWADYVIDLEPTIFAHFGSGDPVGAGETWDRTIMRTRESLR